MARSLLNTNLRFNLRFGKSCITCKCTRVRRKKSSTEFLQSGPKKYPKIKTPLKIERGFVF